MSADSVVDPGHQNIKEIRPNPVECIAGTVEHVMTYMPESGWGVYKVSLDGANRGKIATVVGMGTDLRPGVYIAADGRWTTHAHHGDQFKADVIRLTPPSTAEGVLRYLSSGMIKGIGAAKAKAIVDVFGEDTLTIIEKTPRRLLEIPGVGCRLMEGVVASWKEHAVIRDLMIFLQRYGIPTSKSGKIHKKYGAEAAARISADPYILARDIDGIGFLTADHVAKELGVPPHSLKRVAAGIVHTLEQLKDDGHSAGPREIVLKKASAILDLEPIVVEEALDHLVSLGELEAETVRGRALIYLPYMRAYERSVATILLRLAGQENAPTRAIPFDEALAKAEVVTKKVLSESQRQALVQALRNNIQVITGGPGSGKSTILHTLLEIISSSGLNLRVMLCAPTGRAAKRMEEVTGRPAVTIHRLLEFRPQFGDFARNHRNPLEGDIFIMDESSMLDLALSYKFLRALPKHAQVLFVGDVDQLPSVGAGSVLADIIQSGSIPVVWLREIFRQAAMSKIIVGAHAINEGKIPETPNLPTDDFFFMKIPEPDNIKAMLIRMVTERIPARFKLDPLKDVQVLAPMHKGPLGIGELNKLLQRALNAANLNGPKFTSGHNDFYIGDKVMQLKNDYDLEVFNGDVGFIREIYSEPGNRKALIEFDDRQVEYPLSKFNELTLAYSCSIHKAQGSEWPAVVMPMVRGYFHMLQKNLIYTGLTRGKKLVVMIGDKSALAIACRNNKANERYGGLQQRLAEKSEAWLVDESLFPE